MRRLLGKTKGLLLKAKSPSAFTAALDMAGLGSLTYAGFLYQRAVGYVVLGVSLLFLGFVLDD